MNFRFTFQFFEGKCVQIHCSNLTGDHSLHIAPNGLTPVNFDNFARELGTLPKKRNGGYKAADPKWPLPVGIFWATYPNYPEFFEEENGLTWQETYRRCWLTRRIIYLPRVIG